MTIYDENSDYWLRKTSLTQDFARPLREHITDDQDVLDIGCGGGRVALAVSEFARASGVDKSAELAHKARLKNPQIAFYTGDVETRQTWKDLPWFDVFVSNAAIRKDGCRLEMFLPLLLQRASDRPTTLIFRIQGEGDLPNLVLNTPFYDKRELFRIFREIGQIRRFEEERYQQRFSSMDYLHKSIRRMGLQPNPHTIRPQNPLMTQRHYYLVVVQA